MDTEDPAQQDGTEGMASNGRPFAKDLFGERVPDAGGRSSFGRAARPATGSSQVMAERETMANLPPERKAMRGWGEPERIASDIPPPEPYPIECWGALRNVIEVISGRTGVSIPVAAATVLPSVSLLAQKEYLTPTLGSEPAPPSVYSLGLVSSGGRKTTSFSLSLRAHLEADAVVVARYEIALAESKSQNPQGESEEGPGLIPREVRPNAVQGDVTKAAIIKGLAYGRPAQCLAMSDAGVFMSNHSSRRAYAAETFQTLTALWDGQSHTLKRANIDIRLDGRTLSIGWLAQREFGQWLFSSGGELGLSGRFLVCSDDHWTAPRITDEEIEVLVEMEAANHGIPPVDRHLQRFWDIISAARRIQDEGMEYLRGPSGGRGEPPTLIRRTEDAHRFLRYYGRSASEDAEAEENPHVRSFLRRAPEHASRLAAAMTAWDQYAAQSPAGTGLAGPVPPATIDEGTMQRAVTLVNWYAGEMTRITFHSGYSEVANLADTLSRLLSGAAAGDIMQSSKSGRSYLTVDGRVQVRTLIAQRMPRLSRDPDLQERVLRVLERHEHIRMRGGTQCDVNPALRHIFQISDRGQSNQGQKKPV